MVRTFGPPTASSVWHRQPPGRARRTPWAAICALPLTQEEQDGILGGNAQRLLNFLNI